MINAVSRMAETHLCGGCTNQAPPSQEEVSIPLPIIILMMIGGGIELCPLLMKNSIKQHKMKRTRRTNNIIKTSSLELHTSPSKKGVGFL